MCRSDTPLEIPRDEFDSTLAIYFRQILHSVKLIILLKHLWGLQPTPCPKSTRGQPNLRQGHCVKRLSASITSMRSDEIFSGNAAISRSSRVTSSGFATPAA